MNAVGPGQYDTCGKIGSMGFGKVKDKGFGSEGHNFGGKGNSNPGPGNYIVGGKDEYDYNHIGFGTGERKHKKEEGLGPG